jgi:hypothetical protein
MVFKFAPTASFMTICFVQKITNANGNRTILGGLEDLIKTGDHIKL